MGGVVAIEPDKQYVIDSFKTTTNLAVDLVDGDVVVLDSTETQRITQSTANTETAWGVVGQVEGATAAGSLNLPVGPDAEAWIVLFGHVRKVRIQDNATVVAGAALMISGATPGALVTATSTNQIVARATAAITSGDVDQFTSAHIYPPTGGLAP